MGSPAPPNSSKFNFFARSRAKSPAPPRKRDPPPVLTLRGPPSPQDRWEAESDGEAQEFRSHEAAGSIWQQSAPIERVSTAPLTLLHSPSPRYPLHPYTASHAAQFLAPSPLPHRPGELQHPFSASYEPRRSLESDSDSHGTSNLRRARKANGRRPTPVSRDTKDVRTLPQLRTASPDARQRAQAPPAISSAHGSPHAAVVEVTVAEGEEVDLDLYPWFMFQYNETEEMKSPIAGQDCSFMSL